MDTPNTKEDNEKHNTRGNDDDNGDYSEDFEKLIRDCQRQIRRNKREILDAERLLNEAFSRLESMNDELDKHSNLLYSKDDEAILFMARMAQFVCILRRQGRELDSVTTDLLLSNCKM